MLYIFFVLAIVVISLYKRYVPVKNIPCVELKTSREDKNTTVLDIRDYNISYKNQVNGAINLPLPYLNRYLKEIPKMPIHLVVSNAIEKNMGIRFLNKKGYKVTGFTCLNEQYQKAN